MDPIELGVLQACHEAVLRQGELLPRLAAALKVPQEQVFYTWAFRKCEQHGSLEGTAWVYFFHGLECDLKNTADGRFVRVDFGPGGRPDTFTAWGILQLIMTSVPPWQEFPQLQARFANAPPPFDQYSGSLEKMGEVWDRLEAKGAFERAAPNLVELEAMYTTFGADGVAHIQFPPEVSEETAIDCSVAGRACLTPQAIELVKKQLIGRYLKPGTRLTA
jgi:hypothetical protein